MGKIISTRLAGPDDPIYKAGCTIYTPSLRRASTPSTALSQKSAASKSGEGSKERKAKTSRKRPPR